MKLGTKKQYMSMVIERGVAGYHVFDWDYEGDGETIRTLRTLEEAERFIERQERGAA